MKDYYKTLGIDKSATKEDIKKAFRKLAHEHHPDKTKGDATSAQKFKEASEAYSVLSDDAKRKQYDTYGASGAGFNPGAGGFGGQGGFGGFDFSGFQQGANGGVEFDLGDLFGDFFGGRGGRQSKQQRGEDIHVDIEISFEDAVFGVEKDIAITKMSKCDICKGSGGEPGTQVDTCKTCKGEGKVHEARRSFIGMVNTTRVCETCHGKGKIPKVKCRNCYGEGVEEREQELSVKIPAGIESGQMIRLTGMGEAIAEGSSGDLYVRIHVKPHAYITRKGQDLVTDLKIKLTQAILGAKVPLKSLDGELELVIPEGVNNGEILRVRGKGVPNDAGRRGDLLVHISVDMPKKLSKAMKQLVEELGKNGL